MKAINLFWMIVWAIVFAFGVVGVWFNWAHIITVIVSAVFTILFAHDYYKEAKK